MSGQPIFYKKDMEYNIKRDKPVTTHKGKRRGIVSINHEKKGLVKVFLYRIGNRLSLTMAKKDAEKWVKNARKNKET